MNSGSRPIARIARTGELTPPGSTATARPYRAADFVSVSEDVATIEPDGARPPGHSVLSGVASGTRSDPGVLALPVPERLGEVEHPDLLELRGRVQGGALTDAGLRGDGLQDRVALLL